jgi:prophage antirepressor-like protein
MAIQINDHMYLPTDHIITLCPVWCKGSRNGREFVRRAQIPDDQYEYARETDGIWQITDGRSAKCDKVVVLEAYIVQRVEYIAETAERDDAVDRIANAPDTIELDDSEKFTDEQGNVMEIETRGTRQHDNIFFKMKDVSVCFEIKNLHNSLIHPDGCYVLGKDYTHYICDKTCETFTKKQAKKTTKKVLFMTYTGMLRMLFVSRSGHANKFVKWATEKLFTIQMGTAKQKQTLASKVLGVSAQAVREVFRTSSTSIPSIYLFVLGTVKQLRDIMHIDQKYPDDALVCKYGFTIDLPRRTAEHTKTYGAIQGVELSLKHHSYIDPMYISQAESDLTEFFEALDIRFKYEKYDELVIIRPNLFKMIASQYKHLTDAYAGHIKDMIKRIEDMTHRIALGDEQNKTSIMAKDLEIEKLKNRNELLAKELEIQKLKVELLGLKKTKK